MRTAPPIRPATVAAAGAPGVAPVTTVDPRISARRVAVRRAEGQRRLRRLAWIGGAVGVLALGVGSTRTPLLDVDRIEVAGTEDPAVADALAAAGIEPGRALVDLDLAAGETAVEALPWVADARVRRRWPGVVDVDVSARVPVASVPVTGGTALIAQDGIVVAVKPAPSDLVVVEGPPTLSVGDRFEHPELLEVASALPVTVRPLVGMVAVGDGDGVELRLVEGGVVRLGSADELDDKLVAAATVLTQVDRSCLLTVDVRVPSVPTVTRQPSC